MNYYNGNIENETLENSDFRRVLFTGKNSQLVLMSIKPGDEIGEEIHEEHDQFIRVEAGEAKFIINDEVVQGGDGFAVVIPAGFKHNVINIGEDDLRVYTIYSPAEHPDGTIHKTKQESLESHH